MNQPVIGLIGGIGSGKSRVAAEFARFGARIVSGDQLGHEALRQPEIGRQVTGRWGTRILKADGTINRSSLGALVFADAAQLRELERFVFPFIEKGIADQIAQARSDAAVPMIVLDAAILLEAGWDRFCDCLVFVDAPRARRLERIQRQRGWSEKEVDARAHAQLSLTEKMSRADAVLDNSGAPENLARQVQDLVRQWGLAAPRQGADPVSIDR
jgi:dephospho-CoA kinase